MAVQLEIVRTEAKCVGCGRCIEDLPHGACTRGETLDVGLLLSAPQHARRGELGECIGKLRGAPPRGRCKSRSGSRCSANRLLAGQVPGMRRLCPYLSLRGHRAAPAGGHAMSELPSDGSPIVLLCECAG